MHWNVDHPPDERITFETGGAVQAIMAETEEFRARLVHYAPGTRIPAHQHKNC